MARTEKPHTYSFRHERISGNSDALQTQRASWVKKSSYDKAGRALSLVDQFY